jgi:hypothetical protein
MRCFLLLALCGCGAGENGREPHLTYDLYNPDAVVWDLSSDHFVYQDAWVISDPKTCDEAKTAQSYVGCDYWPTVTSNSVWSIFDFGVVVANAGDVDATVTVTGPGAVNKTTTVAPNSLAKIYLPWVKSLKGLDMDQCATPVPLVATVNAPKGAYHLTSTVPVIVYQFNALEYRAAGGPVGKDWTTCPGTLQPCSSAPGMQPIGCFSFTNDASLLLPTTALTGNYRVTGQHGETTQGLGAYAAVTGTADGTSVTVKVGQNGNVVAGGGISAAPSGGMTTFTLNAGDVVELLSGPSDSADLSGSLIQADKPVQVITGNTCFNNPSGVPACDHLESAVFPAETLGAHYVVTTPTSPNGTLVGHTVRLYGNVDNTQLVYDPKPSVAPSSINAGQVIDLGLVPFDFEITGSHEFAVASFQLGGTLADPKMVGDTTPSKGDPSQSLITAVEQYRLKYVFLAPDDYDVNFAVVQVPLGTTMTLDGTTVTEPWSAVGGGGFGVVRIQLGAGMGGAHLLTSTMPVGLQVMGYGAHTSYQVPGGVNLLPIAPPPVK